MRIAFVSDAVYPWNVGGLETLESTEAQELAKDHEVHFFSLQWPGMPRKDFMHKGMMYHTLHKITTEKFYRHGRRSIREALVFSLGLFRIFFYKFDCIEANEFPILHIPILKLYCMLNDCKLILDVHEVWDKGYWNSYVGNIPGFFANAYASTVLKLADAYIANSSITSNGLQSLGVDRERITVFSPVINDKELNRVRKGRESKSVIFSGRLIKEKRLDKWVHIIKAASRAAKGLKGVIIGDGPEKDSIRNAINDAGLGHAIEMRDFYRTEAKLQLYERIKESKMLLQMSEREGLSIIVLESLALGTPVVLPDYSPIPKEVKAMCVVCKEGDMPRMVARIARSRDKGSFIRNEHMLERFSASHTNEFYKELFRKLGKG